MIGSVCALVNQDMYHLSAIYRDRAWQSHLQVKKAYSILVYEAYTAIAYSGIPMSMLYACPSHVSTKLDACAGKCFSSIKLVKQNMFQIL